jgi:hypothetical protein
LAPGLGLLDKRKFLVILHIRGMDIPSAPLIGDSQPLEKLEDAWQTDGFSLDL